VREYPGEEHIDTPRETVRTAPGKKLVAEPRDMGVSACVNGSDHRSENRIFIIGEKYTLNFDEDGKSLTSSSELGISDTRVYQGDRLPR